MCIYVYHGVGTSFLSEMLKCEMGEKKNRGKFKFYCLSLSEILRVWSQQRKNSAFVLLASVIR